MGVRVSAQEFGVHRGTEHPVHKAISEPPFLFSGTEVESWQLEGQTALPDHVTFALGVAR